MLYSVVAVAVLILDIIAIVSVLGGRGSTEHKVLWTVLILILPLLGMFLYFTIGRNTADA